MLVNLQHLRIGRSRLRESSLSELRGALTFRAELELTDQIPLINAAQDSGSLKGSHLLLRIRSENLNFTEGYEDYFVLHRNSSMGSSAYLCSQQTWHHL